MSINCSCIHSNECKHSHTSEVNWVHCDKCIINGGELEGYEEQDVCDDEFYDTSEEVYVYSTREGNMRSHFVGVCLKYDLKHAAIDGMLGLFSKV